MILKIMSDIGYFILILGIVLTGFAMAFWLLAYPHLESTAAQLFGSIPEAFINTFLFMLGQGIISDFSGTASPQLGVFLLVMFMMFMMILMLNLLIALMGNSYSKVQEKGLAEWRLGQASIMLEQSYLMSKKTKILHNKYNTIHVLKHTSLIVSEDRDVKITDGQLSTVRNQMEAKFEALEKALMEKLNDMKDASGDKAVST